MSMDYDLLVYEENRRILRLRRTIDLVCAALYSESLTVDDALDLMNFARRKTVELFPDKETVFDLIYSPRLARIVAERFAPN
jgi:hypothetical protein